MSDTMHLRGRIAIVVGPYSGQQPETIRRRLMPLTSTMVDPGELAGTVHSGG